MVPPFSKGGQGDLNFMQTLKNSLSECHWVLTTGQDSIKEWSPKVTAYEQ